MRVCCWVGWRAAWQSTQRHSYQRVNNTELKIIHSVVCVGRRMHLIPTCIGRTTNTHALQERVVPAGRGARAR
jgi:hypothetical protein